MKKSLSILMVTLLLVLGNAIGFAQEKKVSLKDLRSELNIADKTQRVIGHNVESPLAYLAADFEDATFPPTGWTLVYSGTTVYWSRVATASGYGVGTATAKFNNYNATTGTTQSFVSPTFAASVASDTLKFDHAYATYTGGEVDQLKIETSADGGTTWTELILLDGGNSGPLATAPGQSSSFLPTAAQWATKAYGLPVGTNKVRFTAISAYGNNLYIDNIRLGTAPAADAGVVSIDIAAQLTPGNATPKATIKNFGSAAQSFNVTLVTSGYTSTKAVSNLAAGATEQVTFDNWFAPEGSFTFKAYTQLAGDANPANDTITKNVSVSSLAWSSLLASPQAVSRSCAVKAGNYIFQFGGGATTQLTAVAKYDIAANTWTTTGLATIPSGISSGTAVAIDDDNILVFGGESTAGLGKTYKYTVSTNTWTTMAAMPTAVTDALVLKAGNLVYVIGGGDGTFGTVVTSAVQVYNISTDSYATGTALPAALGMAAGGYYNGKIMVTGGWDGAAAVATTLLGTVSSTDPTQITWETTSVPYPAGTIARVASYVKGIGTNPGIVFAGGALAASTPTNLAYIYSFATGQFEAIPNLPVARSNMKAAGNGTTEVYVVAGYNGTAGVGNLDKLTLQQSTTPALTVSAPNGGEMLNIGDQTNITWNASLIQNVKIEYSTNNGTSWMTIAATVPAKKATAADPKFGSRSLTEGGQPLGVYTWTVPNTPTTTGLVKLTALDNGGISDVSNAVFTIRTAPVTNVKFEDNFNGDNTVAGVTARGWKWVDQDGGGVTFVYNGVTSVFTAFEGPDTGYAAQNYSGANGVYIDQWLISKPLNIAAGDSLTFWFRGSSTQYHDSIQVLYSPTGDTALSAFTYSFGTFICPPTAWTKWAKTFPTAGANGRFAIRYLIYDGGQSGAYSSYWGLDAVKVIGEGQPQPQGWTANLAVKDAGNVSGTLVFGQHPQATNGIDAALGELSLPPAPPAGVYDSRFILPVTPADASLKDLRNDTLKTITWNFTFQPGAGGYPFTLTWDAASLPTGSFFLKDAITGTIVNVDMKAQSSYTLTNAGIAGLKIEFSKSASASISMNAGWNIFSVPMNASSMVISSMFPTATSPAYGYNAGYVTADTAKVDKGYWIRMPQAGSVTVSGTAPAANTVALVQGWNLIGVHMNPATVSAITTTPAGIINSPFYGYNAGYSTPTALEVGKGYWVRASAAGVINLPASLAKGGEQAQTTISKDWGKISIIDREGKSVTLYSANKVANLSSYDLPPVPPTGIFDVRFATGRNVEVLGTESKDVVINSAEFPVTVRIDGASLQIKDKATNGQIVNQVVRNNGSFTLTNSAATVLEVTSLDAKPNSFELSQNYPNPFNPSTTIRFAIPEKANVSLTIYNQLGEKVAVLLSGEMEAGYHKVEFNGSNLTSGVYFYEIKAGSFSAVKKLMLMK